MKTELTQKTIETEVSFEGVSLFLGKKTQVVFKSAGENTGIHFFKKGRSIGVIGKDSLSSVTPDLGRCSAIGDEATRVLTIEHLLAAVVGMGISNLEIDVLGDEVPIADGSAKPWVDLLKTAGIREQNAKQKTAVIQEPIFCSLPGKALAIYPANELSISFVMDYDYPYLRDQKAEFKITPEIFEKEIAPARTFCTEDEARDLKSRGLASGGTTENNIIVSKDGSHEKSLRYHDECVRHKILDVVGDLSLLGYLPCGKVIALRSGHVLNRQLVEAIKKQRGNHG